ncbi:MAG: hypothetical protein ACRD2B_03855 [Terriglobia bacterium]
MDIPAHNGLDSFVEASMANDGPRAVMEEYFAQKLSAFYARVTTERVNPANYAAPCLPYVGPAFFEEANLRMLFVGKATNGWGSLGNAIADVWPAVKLFADSERFIRERIIPFYGRLPPGDLGCYQSSFWRRIYSLTCRVLASQADLEYQREATRAQRCFGEIAWTNLFKVGTSTGNPDSRMSELLLECLNTLPDEMQMLKPRIVIFSTGSTYDHFLSRAFSETLIIERPRERFSLVGGLAGVACALRTPHFQACTNGEFNELCRTVTAAVLST